MLKGKIRCIYRFKHYSEVVDSDLKFEQVFLVTWFNFDSKVPHFIQSTFSVPVFFVCLFF